MELSQEPQFAKEDIIKIFEEFKTEVNLTIYQQEWDAYKLEQTTTQLVSKLNFNGFKSTTHILKAVRGVSITDGRYGEKIKKKRFDDCKKELLEEIRQQLFYLRN